MRWNTKNNPSRQPGAGASLALAGVVFAVFAVAAAHGQQSPADRRAEALQRIQKQAQGAANAPNPAQPAAGAAAGEAAAAFTPVSPDEVRFAEFSEPVDLQALIDLVSKRLNINIIMPDGAPQGQVVFRAPMTVKNDQLIPLLQMLLEPNGFTLTKEPEGWYVIRPSSNLTFRIDGGELATTQVYPTPLVRPSALKSAIDSSLPADQSATVKIAYVDALGLLIATAPPRLNRSIQQVIELVLNGIGAQRIHKFDLVYVAASEARERILDLLGQGRAAAGAGAGAAGGPAAVAAPAVSAMSNLQDRLVGDRQGNSLIFRGDDAEAAEVQQLVNLVDAPSRLVVRRYQAGPMSATIAGYGERLGLGQISTGAASGARAPTGAPAAAGGGGAMTGSGFVLDGGEALAFTYYGTAEQHKEVQKLVDDFAEQSRGEVLQIMFYKLRHAKAVDTAELLSQLLETSQTQTAQSPFLPGSTQRGGVRGLSRQGGNSGIARVPGAQYTGPAGGQAATTTPGAPAAPGDENALTPTEGVSITADEPNNQLIVRAPAKQQAELARIIDKLDQRKAQVYVDVIILTVDHSKNFSVSVDTALSANGPNSLPAFTNFGLRPQAPPNPQVGIALPDPMGATFAIIKSNYIPFIISGLQTNGDGRVVSSPKILVNDNEQAQLTSTTDEPFATTTQVAGAPSQTGLGGTLSAGTTLQIRPQVSEGGFMIMEFNVELSAFGERPNPDLPPTRRADTVTSVVTVPSDSTVVVGGLTFSTSLSSFSRIPILGDIPIIGWLFGSSYSDSGSDRTLYVFITPRVLRDPTFSDLRLLTRGPREKMGVADVTPTLEPAGMPVIAPIPSPTPAAADAGVDGEPTVIGAGENPASGADDAKDHTS